MSRLLGVLLFLSALFAATPAFAKKITLEWAPEKQAITYELQVRDSSGKQTIHRRVDESQYRGNLKPGVYFWQIRGIDRLKRPGRWTAPAPLVVMAAPPVLQSPEADSEMNLYYPSATVLFKWEAVPGAAAYLFVLSKDGSPVLEKEVTENSLNTPIPDSGRYAWTVQSVFTPGADAPEAFRARRWQSDGVKPIPLSIEHKTLAQAQIVEPVGLISMPERGSLRFAWASVENADAYEVRLETHQPLTGNGIATEKVFRTKKTAIEIGLRALGVIEEGKRYAWTVRAIPLRAPANFTSENPNAGLSKADFEFSTESRDLLRRGSLEFNTFLAPTSYRFVAPDSGFAGETTATASGVRLYGVRSSKARFGYWGSFENLGVQIADTSYALRSLEFGVHYRKSLANRGPGWLLNARLGLGWKEYLEVFPTVIVDTVARTVTITGTDDLKVSTLGLASGLDLKRFITEHWSMQFGFAHYLPMMKTGSSQVSSLESGGVLDNYALNARAGWESRQWGYNLGIFYEQRGVKFNRKLDSGASSNTDESASSAFSIFAGVGYSFY